MLVGKDRSVISSMIPEPFFASSIKASDSLELLAFVVEITMKEYARAFYKSKQWEKCRAGYIKYVGGLCERCLKNGAYVPGVIVHHKCYLSPENIQDPSVTLNFDNLELLCLECHNKEHLSKHQLRYTINIDGKVRF